MKEYKRQYRQLSDETKTKISNSNKNKPKTEQKAKDKKSKGKKDNKEQSAAPKDSTKAAASSMAVILCFIGASLIPDRQAAVPDDLQPLFLPKA